MFGQHSRRTCNSSLRLMRHAGYAIPGLAGVLNGLPEGIDNSSRLRAFPREVRR